MCCWIPVEMLRRLIETKKRKLFNVTGENSFSTCFWPVQSNRACNSATHTCNPTWHLVQQSC